MAVKLLAINDVYNIREAKYIVDEENEKDLIPEEDKVQGTKVLVIKGSKEYRMDSNKNWVLMKGEGGGDSLPDVSSTDNGKVLGVVNGEWNTMSAPGGGDFFIINATLAQEYDSQTDTYPYVVTPDKTPEEVASAIRDGKYLVVNAYYEDWNRSYIMSCVTNNIVDGDDEYCNATAKFVATEETRDSIRQSSSTAQYVASFEYRHPATGSGSEPTVSWSFNEKANRASTTINYCAKIKISTEQITPSTTYTVDTNTDQGVASQMAKIGELSIGLYYGNYNTESRIYKAINCYTAPSTIINKKKIYFDVIDTLDTTTTQLKLYKLCWDGDNTITLIGLYSIPIPALPAVTSSDNGKVLGVVNGEWDKMAPSGGGDDFFTIHATIDSNENVTVTESDADILAAIQANKNIVAISNSPTDDSTYFFYREASYYDGGNNYTECYLALRMIPIVGGSANYSRISGRHLEYNYYKSGSDSADVTWDYYAVDKKMRLEDTVFEVNVTLNNGTYQPSRSFSEARDAYINNGSSLHVTVREGENSYTSIGYSQKTIDSNQSFLIYTTSPTLASDFSPTGLKVRVYKWVGSFGTNGIFTYIGEQTVGGDSLPTVTASDDGKVLGVVNGAWDKMNAPGVDTFTIHGSYVDRGGYEEFVAEESHEDIIDAIMSRKNIRIFVDAPESEEYPYGGDILQCLGATWGPDEYNPGYFIGGASFTKLDGGGDGNNTIGINEHHLYYAFSTYPQQNYPLGSWEDYKDNTTVRGLPSATSSNSGSVPQVNSSGEWAMGLKIQEHDYTVTYADGTTATLKNVEVV